jgi:amino acid transporter
MAEADESKPSWRTAILNAVLGRPLPTGADDEVKIGPAAGIPAMGLDSLSSIAYGPEATLTMLLPLGLAGLHFLLPITVAISALLIILYLSYRQIIEAYPVNGGSYTVAKENLGPWAGLLAAAALMIDYILNVAVGISAGVAALVSAAPSLHHLTLPICLGILAVITLMNLRGTGEAGLAFALPTYLFIAGILFVLITGICRVVANGGHPHAVVAPPAVAPATEVAGLWIVLRSFASGCTAMTGIEAVSNGVSAFRKPTVRNAHITLTVIVVTLLVLLIGVSYLAPLYHIGAMDQSKSGYQSVLSQLSAGVFGRGWIYRIVIASVLAVLCLSANTSFVGFPRLTKLIAEDDYLPRPFALLSRRLVYSVGIFFLTAMAAVLLIAYRGITDKLIPLFAVGAFLAFTLSQAGMVVHWKNAGQKPGDSAKGARWRMIVNATGAVCTGAALVIILIAKFANGAWIVVLAIPAMLCLFWLIHRHYRHVDAQMHPARTIDLADQKQPVALVPISACDKVEARALRFAMLLSDRVYAVHLHNLSGDEAAEVEKRMKSDWQRDVVDPAKAHGLPEPQLKIVPTPYRDLLQPFLAEIDHLKAKHPDRWITVIVPEIVEPHWWAVVLHRNKPAILRRALNRRRDPRVIAVSVPWYLEA